MSDESVTAVPANTPADPGWRCRSLMVMAFLTTGCGVDRRPAESPDAGAATIDSSPDAASDTSAATCSAFVASSSTATESLSFAFEGGAFESQGCEPVDPTFWMAGSGMSVTVSFDSAQTNPSIRVWGMNSDDSASISVNGAAYPLDATSAIALPKVICGLSPGADGVTFVGGNLAGANTPAQGNYSHQDVVINAANVTTIRIDALTGAGWGFVGVFVATECPTS